MFEDLTPHKVGSPSPLVRPLDDSQGSSPFRGHGPWFVCEVTLSYNESSLVWPRVPSKSSNLISSCTDSRYSDTRSSGGLNSCDNEWSRP